MVEPAPGGRNGRLIRRGNKVVNLPREKGLEAGPAPRRRRGPALDPGAESADRTELIEEAAELFSRRYGLEVSTEEAAVMLKRLATFFGLLLDLDRGESSLERAA